MVSSSVIKCRSGQIVLVYFFKKKLIGNFQILRGEDCRKKVE